MKTIAQHGYYKSLLQYQNKKNQLAFALETLVKLHNVEIVDDLATLPKAFFYAQLKELKDAGIISKVQSKWQINMHALNAKNDITR